MTSCAAPSRTAGSRTSPPEPATSPSAGVAADIHGKNHHVDGSFAAGVDALGLQTPVGRIEATPEHRQNVFWATHGGMGLTGVVTDAHLQLTPIETSRVVVDTERAADVTVRDVAGDVKRLSLIVRPPHGIPAMREVAPPQRYPRR